MAKERVFIGTGRRKSSVARVSMTPGKGNITVNGKDVKEFFPYETNIMDLKQPLVATNNEETFDIVCKVNGGGYSGQAGDIVQFLKKLDLLHVIQEVKNVKNLD